MSPRSYQRFDWTKNDKPHWLVTSDEWQGGERLRASRDEVDTREGDDANLRCSAVHIRRHSKVVIAVAKLTTDAFA